MSNFEPEQQGQLTALCQTIADNVKRFMCDPKNRKDFEVWYAKRYGKPYVWRVKT